MVLEKLSYNQFNKLHKKYINLFLVLLAHPRRISEFRSFSVTKANTSTNKSLLKIHDKL